MAKLSPKKSLGQNFLTNPQIPELMADAAGLARGDTVLEIGPGTGVLTKAFLARGARVVAVEADLRAVAVLSETFAKELAEGQLTLHHADIREANLRELEHIQKPHSGSATADFGLRDTVSTSEYPDIPQSPTASLAPKSAVSARKQVSGQALGLTCGEYRVIANIPYFLSGVLFRLLLSGDCQPKTLVFLTQKEVAERIARDKKESLLSLSVKAYGVPKYIKAVARGNFTPQPNVDSAIIAVTDINKQNFADLNESFFFEILHLGFGQKRKQLLGNLSKRFERSELMHAFSTLSIPERARAEDVDTKTWLALAKTLQ